MNQSPTHIYWFASAKLHNSSTRYRAYYPAQHFFSPSGISTQIVLPCRSISGLIRFMGVYLSALLFRKRGSMIIVQKVCSNGWYARALKLLVRCQKPRTLYDIDDAEYLRHSPETLHFFLRHCESVSVGSDALMKYCVPFNSKVYKQTSPILSHEFRKRRNRSGRFTIGWVGDAGRGDSLDHPYSHKRSLFEFIFQPLLAINSPIRLVLIGIKDQGDREEIHSFFADSPHIELDIPTDLNWENDLWLYSKIAEFDIGVAPMISHPFNEAKSAFKAKQYLSCGVPVLASDVGENARFVLHEHNGLICSDAFEFQRAIERFQMMDSSEYRQFHNACFDHLESFSIEQYGERLISHFNSSLSFPKNQLPVEEDYHLAQIQLEQHQENHR